MPEGREGRESDLADTRALVSAALAALEVNRERIDDLNVYPVPDGDTGTNMTLTVRAAADALGRSSAESRRELARELTRACLMGARGNSGVILSQLVRGALEVLAEREDVALPDVARALRAASDAAYGAVREPQEGTILSVARALAERAEDLAAQDASRPLVEALPELVSAADDALARTPAELPLLAEAGVVDAGGAGLVELARGLAAHLRGEALPEPPAASAGLPLEAVHRELSRFRYCTSFFVEGEGAEPESLEHELAAFGDSLLVVGGPGAVKVHVHTDDPGRALTLAAAMGVLEEVDIKNMHAQTREREGRLAGEAETVRSEVVAVCAGAGNARLFRSLGAGRVVSGGQTMNPPTSELLAAIEAAPAEEVVVLPNNKNVVLAAEQAAREAGRRAVVVPTTTVQAGLAAMVAFDPGRSADENAREMVEAAASVRAGAVTRASRAASFDGVDVEEGHFLGLVDGRPVATGTALADVARRVVELLLEGGPDVLTILVGEGAAGVDGLRDEIARAHPDLELEVHEGGQPHYPLLLAAE
ncbi:MAG: DAK2 domain-containing protein [Thermoleophilia bacterium]|nr:DAK2 domain-containing protein [Thermoleophilia bacterium]